MNETFAKSPLENETEQEIELAPDLENTVNIECVCHADMDSHNQGSKNRKLY